MYGAITLSSNRTLALTGATTGMYAGILIDQDRHDTQTLNISGNAAAATGIIYAPTAQLVLSGSASSMLLSTCIC